MGRVVIYKGNVRTARAIQKRAYARVNNARPRASTHTHDMIHARAQKHRKWPGPSNRNGIGTKRRNGTGCIHDTCVRTIVRR